MFKRKRPALQAFEGCPNKALRNFNPTHNPKLEVVCPQYPFGSKDIANEWPFHIGNSTDREAIASKLGCLTCRFKDEPMERVDTQRIAADGAMEVEIRFVPTVQQAAETIPEQF